MSREEIGRIEEEGRKDLAATRSLLGTGEGRGGEEAVVEDVEEVGDEDEDDEPWVGALRERPERSRPGRRRRRGGSLASVDG